MKLTMFLTFLTFVSLGLAAPKFHPADPNSALLIFARDTQSLCDECREHRDVCLKYGMGDGGSGCNKACTAYICRKYDCRGCGDEFNCDDANLTMPEDRL
ncbi:hypothetical protein GRF29_185g758647 [Pseudopithomyces chartarum]|uniref:Uncharacterized protein n=1 Tax=Pseudopithomyces chartarum TaxID=1892770 RepID=A0AAN6LN37_9PLEO|nr:hypothetical protein GRF29_185g758647 [Pseudopithomyces chartarum]